jgi:hypothetical protein
LGKEALLLLFRRYSLFIDHYSHKMGSPENGSDWWNSLDNKQKEAAWSRLSDTCSEVEKQKGNHQDKSEEDSKSIEPKVAIDVLGCMTLYQTLLAHFLVTYVFWLSREVVTNVAVDRHSGVTGIFDTSLNYR